YISIVPPFVPNPRSYLAAGFPLRSGLGGAALALNKWLIAWHKQDNYLNLLYYIEIWFKQ
ncbi:hypothetical protein OQZ29_22485, partial [Pedobacter agri]